MDNQQGPTVWHMNSAQCYVPVWMGERFGGEWVQVLHMTESLHSSPETTTTLLISYSKKKLKDFGIKKIKIQFSSDAQLCPAICNPMGCSTPGLPVHHQLLQPAQTHVHQVGDTIQPSHPLSSPSPLAFNLSQHQGLFK